MAEAAQTSEAAAGAAQPPVTPAPAAAEGAPPGGASPEPDRIKALEEKTRQLAHERMEQAKYNKRRTAELEQAKAALEKEKAELSEWRRQREAEDAEARRAPSKYLQRKFGDKWKDELAQVALSEQVTPGMVASDVEEQVARVRKEFEEQLKKRDEAYQTSEAKRAEAENERHRQEYAHSAYTHIQQNETKYPLLNASGLASTVGQVIETEFRKSLTTDENGEPVGKLLTAEEVATKMESDLKGFYEKLHKAYGKSPGSDANPSSTGSASDGKSPNTQRRTLSNTLASRAPQGWTPPKNEAERRQRALAAWEAAAAQKH